MCLKVKIELGSFNNLSTYHTVGVLNETLERENGVVRLDDYIGSQVVVNDGKDRVCLR